MKKITVILLTTLTILAMVANNYFETKIPDYEKKLEKLKLVYDDEAMIANTNKWIVKYAIPHIKDIDDFDKSLKYLLNMEESIKVNLNTTLNKLDKEQDGMILISLNSKIYRDDIDNLLKLFKIKIPNGYVRLNSFSVDTEYITTNFDLIKFYKDK